MRDDYFYYIYCLLAQGYLESVFSSMFLQATIMARSGFPRAKISILRTWKEARQVGGRNLSKFAVVLDYDRHQPHDKNLTGTTLNGEKKSSSSGNWVPHPRTGIYIPQGQEWVMEDVPKGAASFEQTYWLRTDDGVEKPEPDHYPHWDSNCFHANM